MTATATHAVVDRAIHTLRDALDRALAEGELWAARDLERALRHASQAAGQLRPADAGQLDVRRNGGSPP